MSMHYYYFLLVLNIDFYTFFFIDIHLSLLSVKTYSRRYGKQVTLVFCHITRIYTIKLQFTLNTICLDSFNNTLWFESLYPGGVCWSEEAFLNKAVNSIYSLISRFQISEFSSSRGRCHKHYGKQRPTFQIKNMELGCLKAQC